MNKKLILLLVIFAFALTACASKAPEDPQPTAPVPAVANEIISEGKIKPLQAVNLSFQVRGTVEEINIKIGDAVSKGDVLASLSNTQQAEAQLAAANLELVNAQQSFDKLVRTGPGNLASTWDVYMKAQNVRAEAERSWDNLDLDDIDTALDELKTEVEDRAQDLKDAQEEFDKYKELNSDNSKRTTAKDNLEKAQKDYNEAVRKLEEKTRGRDSIRAALDAAIAAETEAKFQHEHSSNGANKDQLALAQARLDNAKAQVVAAKYTLSNSILTAPFDGVVADVAVEVGEQVGVETRAVSIFNASSWIIETTDITELEVVKVKVGQKVTFIADALKDVTMEGVVTEISQASYVKGGDVVYTVWIAANEVDPLLKWGMTVEVKFEPVD